MNMGAAATGATRMGSMRRASAVMFTAAASSVFSIRLPRTRRRWVFTP